MGKMAIMGSPIQNNVGYLYTVSGLHIDVFLGQQVLKTEV